MRLFASVDELAAGWAGWGKLSDEEQDQAAVLLERASAYIGQKLSKRGIPIDTSDSYQMTNLTTVTCNIVRRSMSPDYDGIKSFAQTIGSTNVSVNYRGNDGGFYLTKDEKELIGLSGRGKVFMLRPAIRNRDGSPAEGW